jgi:hypothetical protein
MTVCAACGQENPEGFKFCDLVGFTSRAETMDYREVGATAYLARAESLVEATA